MMMKKLLAILIVLTSFNLQAQDIEENTGFIMPGKQFTNQSGDTLVYMDMPRFNRVLQMKIKYDICNRKVNLLQEQVVTLEQRKWVSDSAISLKSTEADFWRMKLMENDRQLENSRIENANLMFENSKIRRSRIYYFFGGVVAASIFFIAVN